jgi:hypothetical protein
MAPGDRSAEGRFSAGSSHTYSGGRANVERGTTHSMAGPPAASKGTHRCSEHFYMRWACTATERRNGVLLPSRKLPLPS